MKRTKLDGFMSFRQKRWIQFLIGVGILYLLLMVNFEVPFLFKSVTQEKDAEQSSRNTLFFTDGLSKESLVLDSEEESPIRPLKVPHYAPSNPRRVGKIREFKALSNLKLTSTL